MKVKKLTEEERERATRHVRNCDSLFDGRPAPGANELGVRDREFAYQQLRVLTLELLERLA